MPVSQGYIEYVIDQLSDLGKVSPKRMFGGAGLYYLGMFFGLIADDILYFKVDDGNRDDFTDAGMGPFRPFGSPVMGYYEVPANVLEDPDELARWARKAVEAAGNAKARKRPAPRRGAGRKR